MAFEIGMIVFSRGRIAPDLRRIVDIEGQVAHLEPLSLGTEAMQTPTRDLRRYRLRTTDEVRYEGKAVSILKCLNPRYPGLYEYEIEDERGRSHTVRENYLVPAEGEFEPDPTEQLAQLDTAPWDLVSARTALLEGYFAATARSLGLAGYNGARMLPIAHQLNAARYAILYGRVRFLLADEVGLGKTVEAGLILTTLRRYFPQWQVAIFVPESLTVQWAFEMYGKFGKMVMALEEEDLDEDTPGIILPHGMAPAFAKKHKPDIVIVDEAHRVLRDDDTLKALAKMSAGAHACLLLTATPRSDDGDNVCRLLRLCDPERFGAEVSDQRIQELLARQGEIEAMVQLLRDHEAPKKKVQTAWKGLKLEDAEIAALIASKGESRHAFSHAAALVVDRYYPGARILRYQRKFLAQDNAMAMRIVEPVSYRPTAEETAVIQAAQRWLGCVRDAGLAKDIPAQTAAAALVQSVFSSPLALSDWMDARRGKLEAREGVSADPIRLASAVLKDLAPLPGEEAVLEQLRLTHRNWFAETRHDRASAQPLALLPRYKALVKAIRDFLKHEPEARLLVFTGFEANIRPLYTLLKRELQTQAEVFHIHAGQEWRTREKSAFQFQEHETACILLSDELGGEGRNFQFCHSIIHFDLPPAPWLVEQRIGRCDRVGRETDLDVDSQVLVAGGQLDEAIFEFLSEGVNVFNESIAPIEGSMDRVTRAMLAACIARGSAGVMEGIESVADELQSARAEHEEELLARSRVGVAQARAVASQVDDRAELIRLQEVVTNYARLFDSKVDVRKTRLHMTVGEYHSMRGEQGVLPEMIGNFDRRQAVRHERYEFFSPGHPFVRGLTMKALSESPDRAAIVARAGLAEPIMVLNFLVQLDQSFFGAIGTLPVDLRPPLFCKSAEAFGTRLLRVALNFEGELITDPALLAIAMGERTEEDESLDEGLLVQSYVPDTWENVCRNLSDVALEEAERVATERLLKNREDFEDLLCEVLTRALPTQDWLEEKVREIMEKLARLTVTLDSVVAFFPPLEDVDDDESDDEDDDDDDEDDDVE